MKVSVLISINYKKNAKLIILAIDENLKKIKRYIYIKNLR